MSQETKKSSWPRRAFLGSVAAGAASLAVGRGAVRAAEAASPPRARATVRDHFWIFACCAGDDNDYLERAKVRGGSRMTPAEGAFWLNVPNLLLIRSHDHPRLPGGESWRAKTSFEQYATSFQPLDRVIWSVVGSGGQGNLGELSPVLQLAKKFPNISGIYLDDFIVDTKKQPDGTVVGRPALLPAELKRAREQMKSVAKPMEVWITLYTHEICHPRKTTSPTYRGCDPALSEFLDLFDVLTLWTWNSDELAALEENLVALEKIASKKARIALGLYIWDYHNAKPVPMDLLRHQCESGLKWLKAKRIHEMIFLSNTVLDVGLPSAQFARDWIAKVGSQRLE